MKTIYKVIDCVVSVDEDEHIIQYGSHLFLWYSGIQTHLFLQCSVIQHTCLFGTGMQHTCFFSALRCNTPVSLALCDATHLFLWH